MAWNRIGANTLVGMVTALLGACVAPIPTVSNSSPVTPMVPTVSVSTGTTSLTPSALAGTAWTAFALAGVTEVVQPKPILRWDLSMRVSGSGGCNTFGGAFVLGKDGVRIGPLVPIGKACLTLPGAQEDKFFNAIEATRTARIEGEQLVLLDAAGHQLARLLKNP